jgi:HisJ family histidinol phosphate phosphatase
VTDPRVSAIPDVHGHAKGEHKPYAEERPIPYSARMLFLWFYHAAQRGQPRFMMIADHINYLTFEDPAAVNLVRRALKLAAAGDLYGAAETAGVELTHAAIVSEGLRRGMRYSIGAEVDNDPRSRPDAQNIVDAMKPDGLIRTIHFLAVDHPVHGAGWQWPFDNPEFASLYETVGGDRVWEIYVTTLLEAIEKLPGHVVGHFYVPAKFGHWPDDAKLDAYEDRLIAACRDRGMAIEFNTRFLYRYLEDAAQQRRYAEANLRLMKKAKAEGVGIAVGSDAHSPKDQGVGFERVLGLLDQAGVNELVFPIGGRLARVALRATREHLERIGAVRPAVPEPEPALAAASRNGDGQAGGKAQTPPPKRGARAGDGAAGTRATAARGPVRPSKAAKPHDAPKPAAVAPKPAKATRPAKAARPAKPAARAASPTKAASQKHSTKRGKVTSARTPTKKSGAARAPKWTAKAGAAAKPVRPGRAAKTAAKPAAKTAAKAASRTRKRVAAKPAARKTAPKKAQAKKKQSKSRR